MDHAFFALNWFHLGSGVGLFQLFDYSTLLFGFQVTGRKYISCDRKLVPHHVWVLGLLSSCQEVIVWTYMVLTKWEALSLLENILSTFSAEAEAAEPWLLSGVLPVWHLYGKWGLVPLVIYRAVRIGSQSVRYLTQERVLVISLVESESGWRIAVWIHLLSVAVLVGHLHLGLVRPVVEVLVQE